MTNSKNELRKHFKAIRAAIPAEERASIDKRIAQQVADLPEFKRANAVLAYLSFGTEIETRAIIEAAWDAGKLVALPRCVEGAREMTWHKVESFDGFVKSPLGVEEPAADPKTQIDPYALDEALVLVPGMTFDPNGYRLGYGGGFYDVFLSQFKGCTVGLCREAQMSDQVEALDEHDLPAQIVITENRVMR